MPFKIIEVVGYKDFRKTYDPLPEDSHLKKRIREIRDEMKTDINRGDFIKRKPYPDKYRRLDIYNLYVHDIGNTHRLIYTVRTEKDKKIYQYLDLFTHKEYDVMFGYSTS